MLPSDPNAIVALLRDPMIPIDTLTAIRADYRDRFDVPDVQAALAAHKTSKQALLRHLAASDSKAVHLALAKNRNTPEEVLAELARNSHQAVRVAVASNKSTPLPVLLAMAQADPTAQVAKALAQNAALQSTEEGRAVTEHLAADVDARKPPKRATVKDRVAGLFASSPSRRELEALRNDSAATVRWAAIIRGYELGIFSLDMAGDFIRETPQARPLLEERWKETKDPRIADVMIAAGSDQLLAAAVGNGEISDPVQLEGIVLGKLVAACWAIATTVDLTADLLRYLSTVPSYSWEVWDPVSPESLRPGMVFTPIPNSSYPLGHVACHTQVIVALHPLTPPDILDRLVKARSRHVRAALAERPFSEGLDRLAHDKEPDVRAAVASSDGLTPDLRDILSNDPDPRVQDALRENPAGRA